MYSLPIEDLESIATRLESLWPSHKTILITGGTGFFGRWLVESCAYLESKKKSQNRFIVVSRQGPKQVFEKIALLKQDFFEVLQQDISEDFKIEKNIDYILHAASDVSKIKNQVDSNFTSNYRATQNIVSLAKNKNVKKLLNVSSGGVYSSVDHPVSEGALILKLSQTIDSYGEAKRQSELSVREFSPSCSARCFSFVGPFADENMAVMDMLNKKVRNEKIIVKSPQVVRSFMYPTDLVVNLFRLLFLPTQFQEYNLGSPAPINLQQLASKVAMLHNNSEVVVATESSSSSLAGSYYVPDTSRIEKEFFPQMTIDLDLALLKTYNFLKQQEGRI